MNITVPTNPVSVTVNDQNVTVTAPGTAVSVTASGGIGPQGPAGPSGTTSPATTTALGVVIIGSGLSVTPEGVLSSQGQVSSVAGRTGAITLTTADVSGYVAPAVASVAGRTGAVVLAASDVSGVAAAAPVQSVAGRTGAVVISTSDVSGYTAPAVTSVAGRTGAVVISTSDVSGYTAPAVTSVAGRTGAVVIAAGDVSGLTAAASAAAPVQSVAGRTGAVVISTSDVSGYTAPAVTSVAGRTGAVVIASGDVSGLTAAASAAAPVQSVAGRTGAVVISTSDVSGYTPPPVTSVAGRTGAVVISTSDVSGYAASPVTSVAGRTGAVVIAAGDVSGLASSATTDTTNAANISSGTIGTARLGSGTASSSTYLRGDSTWAAVSSSAPVTNTPTTLAAGANDYALPSADIVRLAASSAVTLTGLSASNAATYPIVLIENVGSFTITLANNSASSAAANRIVFSTGTDQSLAANDSVTLVYDSTSTVWRSVGTATLSAVATSGSAADLATGTLPDARLSSNVALGANVAAANDILSGCVDVFPRRSVASNYQATNTFAVFSFFTPVTTTTVSKITVLSGNAGSGITVCRLGLFTVNESTGVVTCVAKCDNDTSLMGVTGTLYTRSFSTAGGFPATYILQAGTRYAFGFFCVASTTQPVIASCASNTNLQLSLLPRIGGGVSGYSGTDFAATSTISIYTLTAVPWARFSA